MVAATALKNGFTFLMDGKPYQVVKYEHQKLGRGGATVKLSMRNLKNGAFEQKTLSSNIKVEEITTTKKELQYLYSDGEVASFMDPKNYDQVEISLDVIKDQIAYIKEGESVNVMFWDNPSKDSGQAEALSVEIAPKVTLKVAETDPGVKGNSASNVYKSAKLENGLDVKVPLFIKVGEKIRVDTRTGEYVERVK